MGTAQLASYRDRLAMIFSREDFTACAIALSAIALLVVTAGSFISSAGASAHVGSEDPHRLQAVSVLLNVALIIFAWGRHKEARQSMVEKAVAEERNRLLMSRDPATELLNRQTLIDRSNDLIANAGATGRDMVLVVINLRRFKAVNQVHGHAVGDAVLQMVARIILQVAPDEALCARLGADEFAVVLTQGDAEEDAVTAFLERLCQSMSLPIMAAERAITVGTAIGLTRLDLDCFNFSSMLRRADLAMKASKKNGDDLPIWFESRMEHSVRNRNEVEIGLKRGIPAGEFVPYYQPLVEVASGEIRGMEMLARWHHPLGGVVGPEVFIPVAEDLGLIGELSEVLMRTAFQHAKRWDPSLTLAVNISPRQLADPWLPQLISKALSEAGFPAERLEIEITESSLFSDVETARTVVDNLKAQGIRLALDDFGTGYSSLSHLRAFPFDRIKIDRSFLISLNKDRDSWTIVKTILAMAELLNVRVTAEGVESAAIELRLRELNCELGQGWFYGVPLPESDTARLLQDHNLLPVPMADLVLKAAGRQ